MIEQHSPAQTYLMHAQVFKVLTHPTRLAILEVLRQEEQCVCHMEAILGLRQSHISQHLMVLRDAGLVTDRRDGWNVFYRIAKPEILRVIDAVNHLVPELDVSLQYRARIENCPCPKCSPGSNCGMPVSDKLTA